MNRHEEVYVTCFFYFLFICMLCTQSKRDARSYSQSKIDLYSIQSALHKIKRI